MQQISSSQHLPIFTNLTVNGFFFPPFAQSFSFIKTSAQHLGFPGEKKSCMNLSIFFPPVFFVLCLPSLCGEAVSVWRSSWLGSEFSGGIWVSYLLYVVQQGAAPEIAQSSQCPCSTSRAGDFRKGSREGSLNHPPGAAGPSAGSRCLLSFSAAEPEGAVTPLRTEQSRARPCRALALCIPIV